MAERTPLEQLSEDSAAPLMRPQREEARALEEEYDDQKPLESAGAKATHEEEGPEKGRLQEMNAEFLNERMGNYIKDVHKQETEYVEKKYGKGLWGRAKRWLEETDLGKAIKVGVKVIGGGMAAGAMLLGTGGLAAPFLGAIGGRAAVDGVLEGIQYLRERGTIQAVRQARGARMANILELGRIRNRVLQEPGQTAEMPTNIDGENLGTTLERLIIETAEQERHIIEGESNLARSQKWWKLGRFAAGLVTVGATAAYTALHGISMGVHDFDKIHELATQPGAADWIKNMAENMAPSHEVKLYLDSVQSIYDKSEIITNNITNGAITHAPGVIGHHLGANAPWGVIYASVFGALAGLTGAAVKEVADFSRLDGLSKKEIEAAIFSVRKEGRTGLGGAEQEISSHGVTPDSNFWKNLGATEVWSFKGDPNNPDPNGPLKWFTVKKNQERGEVSLVEIDQDTGKEVPGFIEIVKSKGDFYTSLQANKHIFKKEGSSFAEIDAKRKAEIKEKSEKFIKDKGLGEGKLIKLRTAALGLKPGVEYEVTRLDLENDQLIIMGKERGNKRLKQYIVKMSQIAEEGGNISILVPFVHEEAGEVAQEENGKTGREKLTEALSKKGRLMEGQEVKENQIWTIGGEEYVIQGFDKNGGVFAKSIDNLDQKGDIIAEEAPVRFSLKDFVSQAEYYRDLAKGKKKSNQNQQGGGGNA